VNEPRVIELYFGGTTITGQIQGHPTEAIDLAHKIATIIYGQIRWAWRFHRIQYIPPTDTQLDSAAVINFETRVK